MNSAKLNDWLQVIGMFAVVGSLIFVGLQMKQTQQIALAETYNQRAGQTVEAHSGVMGTPQFFSAMAKLYSGQRDHLTAEEYIALENENVIFLTVFENNHFQFERGFLPAAHWQKNLTDLECRMSEPLFRSFTASWNARASFRAVLDQVIARGEQAKRSCWVAYPDELWPYFNPVAAPENAQSMPGS